MFRPPINRAMRVLDRSFFQKKIPISAARILDNRTISKCRTELQRSKDTLFIERLNNIQSDPTEPNVSLGKKCILLRPEVDDKGDSIERDRINNHVANAHLNIGDKKPWSTKVSELVNANLINVIPYELKIDYDYWTYRKLLATLLSQVFGPDALR